MKSNMKPVVAAVAFVSLMALAMPTAAQAAKCSNATLSGTYEATLSGTVNGLPFAALDLVTADGNGNITATGTIVYDGTVIPSTFTATYTVNSDCSGSFSSDTGTTENFLIKENGSEVQIIVTGTPLGPATVTGLAKNAASK
jgi:hypothetical protein